MVSMWFPVFFGSFLSTCYMEPVWFHFSDLKSLGEINHFWNKIAFLDGSMRFPVFSPPLCLHVIWNLAGSHFQILSPFGKINYFWSKNAFFKWFHVVPGVFWLLFVSMLYGTCLVPFFRFEAPRWNKSFLEQNRIFGWFHEVPGVFASFMFTCYMEPSWFPFFKSLAHLGK